MSAISLVVFGATGSVGRELVEQALDRGHIVTAFTRDPDKITVDHDNLRGNAKHYSGDGAFAGASRDDNDQTEQGGLQTVSERCAADGLRRSRS